MVAAAVAAIVIVDEGGAVGGAVGGTGVTLGAAVGGRGVWVGGTAVAAGSLFPHPASQARTRIITAMDL
jgi:hypothetical protein